MSPAALLLLVPIACGLFVDGITSAIGIAAILEASNPVGWVVAGAGGICTTGFAASSKHIWDKRRRRVILVFLWALAVTIDVYTTCIGTLHFIVDKKWFDDPIVIAFPSLTGDNLARIVITIAITVLVTLCPVALPFVFDQPD